jgi:general L-amino acid transport system permease protein
MNSEIYKPGSYPDLPPPIGTVGIYGWIRNNLFSSLSNSLLTFLSITLLYYLIDGIIGWFFFRCSI